MATTSSLGRAFHPEPTKRCAKGREDGYHACPHALPPGKPLPKASKPLPRSTKPIKAKGRPRHKVSGKRNEKFRNWMRTQHCAVRGSDKCWGVFAEAAHVRSRGAGGGDLGNLVPLCSFHHMVQHKIGIKTFQETYRIDLPALAVRLARRFGGAARVSREWSTTRQEEKA